METNRTDKDILSKGLRLLAVCLVLMFMGPFLLHIAFSNQDKPLYIPILIVAVVLCCSAIYFLFKGILTILESMFKKKS